MDRRIETDRLILRMHRPEDRADFERCFSDPEVVRFEPYQPMNGPELDAALNGRIGNTAFIAIESKADQRYIGNIYMDQSGTYTMEMGFVLCRDAWHKGYAAEACRALIADAFANGVHRIWAECDPENTASWKLLERLGFAREAHLKQNVFFDKDADGKPIWKDTYQYALINPAEKAAITIREAGLEELPRIAALKRQIHDVHVKGRPDLFTPYHDLSDFAEHSAAKGCSLLLAEACGEPVGFVMLQYVDRPASPYMKARKFVHVEEFCVDENHQRMGVGMKLMQALKQLAREKGYPRIELDVWSFNEGAKQFYEAAGMQPFRTFREMDTEENH